MKRVIITLLLAILHQVSQAQQASPPLTGKVVDGLTQEPIPGVSVVMKGSGHGTITDAMGHFSLAVTVSMPFMLQISSLGYDSQEVLIQNLESQHIALVAQAIQAQEIIITASRMGERSPLSIERLNLKAIAQSAGPSYYDAIENLKGVQLTTSSLTFKVPNTRGFNAPNNYRFAQLVDGIDMQAATLGVSLGNTMGPTELDIESIAITPGAAGAAYGMNAINGMALLTTKSPFLYPGWGIYHKTGVNHIDHKDHATAILTETAIRYAKVFTERLALKINMSYLRGIDWISNTATDQNTNDLNTANPNFAELYTAKHPAYDAWNRYGDESNNNNLITVQYQGQAQTFNVRRTGYWEKDLYEPTVKTSKVDLGLYYRWPRSLTLAYQYRYGQMDGLFQRGNKIKLNGVNIQNHRISLEGNGLKWNAYMTLEDTGHSYNLKPTADNLDLNNGTNAIWAGRFQKSLQEHIDGGTGLSEAFLIARQEADKGRVEPGTKAFEELKRTITGINNWDIAANVAGAPATGGSALRQRSTTYHSDLQYYLSNRLKSVELLVGVQYRIYSIVPDGNNFVDFSRPISERTQPMEDGTFGKRIPYQVFGAYVSASKDLLKDQLKLTLSTRIDHNPEYKPKINPRLAMVYTVSERNHVRFSIQDGYRFPSLFEALSFTNNGNVRRVGGLARVNAGLGFNDNSYTLASVSKFMMAAQSDFDHGKDQGQVLEANKGLLMAANLKALRPEQISTIEIGYRSVLFSNQLVVDWDAYGNCYKDFLGQVEVAVPNTGTIGSPEAITDMLDRSTQTRYRVYTNAQSPQISYGSSLGLSYYPYLKYILTTNISFNKMIPNKGNDLFVTGFNTPSLVSNIGLSNKEIVKNIGFSVMYRWQQAFDWLSPLANGKVPAIRNVDAQLTISSSTQPLRLKVGGTNIFNSRYIQYAAGPTIGALYYLSITYDGPSHRQ
ncbi:TonB-dependent receptor-like protein [Dyadobacter jejuensis]|uniref:TonB-dependent receptor-like protein n=1 Tax=Dyadobacter jejuensis TaxID=1082580 RepID=A0A316AE88_9BACT|nr:carboxypeptidase-like regulatory domain-containing protein [Dyadobacter jejuensis]PWJ55941.1 TonB-dependent receptor-like protein [Dyadobacter jejuensis]